MRNIGSQNHRPMQQLIGSYVIPEVYILCISVSKRGIAVPGVNIIGTQRGIVAMLASVAYI